MHLLVYAQRNSGKLTEKIITDATWTGKVGGRGDLYELGTMMGGRFQFFIFI